MHYLGELGEALLGQDFPLDLEFQTPHQGRSIHPLFAQGNDPFLAANDDLRACCSLAEIFPPRPTDQPENWPDTPGIDRGSPSYPGMTIPTLPYRTRFGNRHTGQFG